MNDVTLISTFEISDGRWPPTVISYPVSHSHTGKIVLFYFFHWYMDMFKRKQYKRTRRSDQIAQAKERVHMHET